ncbi:XRE family transcriptional regulator [Pseudoalteromonas phenolica]|uniref:XRE family transcriptional regulator n=1 Tax=Pseudoalteromonas phenolica TaxID=161398 RepID=UPI00110C0381|nr:XRE family transcriptional regulator [Pseudoalteromonas phenolica]TMN93458.1 XRE family transcriptional regulator [Pseudoalteromonas phenolica]
MNIIKHFVEYSLRHLPMLIVLTLINLFTAPDYLWVLWVALFTMIGFFNEADFTGRKRFSSRRSYKRHW